jgi:hypothetical protein
MRRVWRDGLRPGLVNETPPLLSEILMVDKNTNPLFLLWALLDRS